MPSGAAVIRYDGKRGVVWRIKYTDADGKQCMETLGAERDGITRKVAEAELRERLVKVERRGWRKPVPLTFADFAPPWFADGPKLRRWKPNTVRGYANAERRLLAHFGPMPLGAIRPKHIREYVNGLTQGPETAHRDLSLLHSIFESARRDELVEQNPAARAERPKLPRNKWRLLKPEEVPVVARSFTDDRARRAFLAMVLLGLRRFELRGLKWGHVDLLERTVRVVESKSEEGERVISLPPMLLGELEAHYQGSSYRSDTDYVFAHPQSGNPIDLSKWYPPLFREAIRKAGITERVRPCHDLRHTALTNLALVGASPFAVMATAGHRSMQTTQRYLHLAGVSFREEQEALERRLLGTVESSTRLAAPQPISGISGGVEAA